VTWSKGQDEIQTLLDQNELERIAPNAKLSERYISEAANHLASAESIIGSDLSGSYDLAYDSARKACAALLAVQGLRATSQGGHIAVGDAVQAQFGPAFKAFNRLPIPRRS